MKTPSIVEAHVDVANLVIDYDLYIESTQSLASSPVHATAMSIAINGIAHGGRLLMIERELYEKLPVGFSAIYFSIKFPSGYSMNDHIKSVKDGNIL